MSSPASVFFYISGHGFGHSVRQIEIINALVAAAAGRVRVIVRTSAPAWLFGRTAHPSVELLPGEIDTGVVQIDSLRLDETATIVRAAEFYAALDERLEAERRLLEQHDAALVVSDAAPLACAAADAAGIPSVVCANFTWDWIYRDYQGAHAAGPRVVALFEKLYSVASAGWRLPLHGGFRTVPKILDVPIVARHAAGDRDTIRAALNLPRDARLALVSFGGYGVQGLRLDRLDCTASWTAIVTGLGADASRLLLPGILILPDDRLYARGLGYPDLVHAVDVVISKPGYGILSDCIANGAALLYTARGRFAEYDVMVRDMPRLLRCGLIPVDDLLDGRWLAALEQLQGAPAPAEMPRTDGASVVVRMILDLLNTNRAS